MVAPSHPGNVGSAARAIKTMGFSDLALVAPRLEDMTAQPEAVALASGAGDVLAGASVHDTLEAALGPVTLAFALTARVRDLGPPPCDIREAAVLARDHLASHATGGVAIVLGTERAGLTNAQIAACHRICHIPANPGVQLAERRAGAAVGRVGIALCADLPRKPAACCRPRRRRRPTPAPRRPRREAVQALLAHWEEALVAVKFLDPKHPKKLMPRMRHLFSRSA